MTRLLGIDLGERRIGLAVAESGVEPARPLATVARRRSIDEDAATVEGVAREQAIDEIVVGLPLEASGVRGTMARSVEAWAAAIGERVRLPVTLRDERLTSHVAEDRLGPMQRGRSGGPPTKHQRDAYRSRVDREAAAIILQDELDTRQAQEAHR